MLQLAPCVWLWAEWQSACEWQLWVLLCICAHDFNSCMFTPVPLSHKARLCAAHTLPPDVATNAATSLRSGDGNFIFLTSPRGHTRTHTHRGSSILQISPTRRTRCLALFHSHKKQLLPPGSSGDFKPAFCFMHGKQAEKELSNIKKVVTESI